MDENLRRELAFSLHAICVGSHRAREVFDPNSRYGALWRDRADRIEAELNALGYEINPKAAE